MESGVGAESASAAETEENRALTTMDAVELGLFRDKTDEIKDSLIEQLIGEVKRLKTELINKEHERWIAVNRLAVSERRRVELRETVEELERKWRDAQIEIAELNVMHSLRCQTTQAGESGLRKELEMTKQNLELYESLTAAAKLRELEQKKPQELDQITKRLTSAIRPRKYSFMRKQADHDKRLREVHRELVNKLIAPTVAAVMYERGALTLTELESVQRCRTPSESAKNLIDVIASLPYESYECFLSALKLADQADVYLWLAYRDYNINVKHTETIRRHYIFLLEALDMKFTILLAELSAVGILNPGEKDEINSEPCITHQNERLLSVLSRKSAEQFEMFLCALDRSGQKHIADKLREKPADDNDNSRGGLVKQMTTMERDKSPVPPPRRLKLKQNDGKLASASKHSTGLCDSGSAGVHNLLAGPIQFPTTDKQAAVTPSTESVTITPQLFRTTSLLSLHNPPLSPKRSASSDNILTDAVAGQKSPNVSVDVAKSQLQLPTLFHSASSHDLSCPPSPAACCQDVVCVIVGDADVDKTNLLLSFLYPDINIGVNCESYTKVALHMPQKLVTMGNVTYNVLLKDTTGQEEFDRLRILSYSSADVFVVCFSVMQPSSFDNVRDKWLPEIRQHCPCTPFVLVGTQKERRITPTSSNSSSSSVVVGTNVCATLARRNDSKYLECSTISREGVDEVFTAAVEAKSKANNKRKLKFKPFRVL